MEPTFVPEVARRFAIGFVFLIHIQFAAFLIGLFTLAVSTEFLWIQNKGNPNLNRLARGMGMVAAIMYSTGAVLAFVALFFLTIFWPTFFYIVFRANFWPFVLEAITFALTLLYLIPWFFTWQSMERFKWAHLALGAALVISAYFQQALIDVVASYMLTPAPPSSFLRVFFNPTAVPLDMHRIAGDISFAGFVVAGFAAFKALRARRVEDRAFWDWGGSLCLIAGLGFLYLQPAIGVEYMEEIRANSPGAFTTMMRGNLSWLFIVQVTFLSVLFLLSQIYILIQTRKSNRPYVPILWMLLIVTVLGSLLLVNPFVIGSSQAYAWVNWVNPVGAMQPWKYIAMAGQTLAAIFAVFIYIGAVRKGMRWGFMGRGGKGAQYLLLTLAVFASFMMALMGYIRENSRIPFMIYNNITIEQPEEFPVLQPTPTPGGPFTIPTPVSGQPLPIGSTEGTPTTRVESTTLGESAP